MMPVVHTDAGRATAISSRRRGALKGGDLEYPPGPIASPSGCFPQSQLRDQVLRGARRDAKFLGDHAGGGDRPGEHIVEQRRQF